MFSSPYCVIVVKVWYNYQHIYTNKFVKCTKYVL
jgi:hypothetical protein